MTGLGEQGLKETWDKEKSRKYQERNEKCQAGIEAAAASCQKVSRGCACTAGANGIWHFMQGQQHAWHASCDSSSAIANWKKSRKV